MATGKAIIYKGIPYFSDVKVPTRVSQLANDAGYLTTHQDISGKADKSATVSTVTWSNNKLTKTINGTTSDVVSAATILGNLTSSQVTTALGYVPGPSYIFESSDNSINISDSMVPGRETIDLTVNGKVSTEGDTISGDYINTADFIESGVTGKRVTTYGPWGIDIDEYVGTSLWSKLALRDSDILLTKTWDGTNTSLKQSLAAIGSDTGWQTVTSSYCDIKVRKIGKVVELTIWSDKAIPASQQIATLADAYKPVISVYPNRLYLRNSISTASDITLRIENNGTIYNTGNANIAGHWVVIHAMWTSYPLPS